MADLDNVTPPLPANTVPTLAALAALPSGSLADGETAVVLTPWPSVFRWADASLGPDEPRNGIVLPNDTVVGDPGRWVFAGLCVCDAAGSHALPEGAAPTTAANVGHIFVSDGTGGLAAGKLYFRREASGAAVRLDDAASVLNDLGNTGAGAFPVDFTDQRMVAATLTGSCAFTFTFPNPGTYTLRLTQDGTGNHVPTLPASARAQGGTVPLSLAAGTVTVLALVWDGSTVTITPVPNAAGAVVFVGV